MKVNQHQLRKIVRSLLQEARRSYLYHASPNPDIGEFVPRPFIHTEDFSSSGIWVSDKPPPEGFKLSNLVFAARKGSTPFYSVPRDTPRILVFIESEDSRRVVESIIREYAPSALLQGKKIFILPETDREQIQTHTWTEYGFDPADFSPVGEGNVEYVASKSVKPILRKKHKNPLRYVRRFGYEVVFVPNVEIMQEIRNQLRTNDIPADSEALGWD